jgi:hypothetical protein
MKHLKTYEAKVGYYPNTTDKQYWIYTYDDEDDDKIIYLLKLIKYDKDYNGEYIFKAMTLTDYKNGKKIYHKGNILDEDFILYDSGIRHHQQNDNLRLATPDEIKLYDMYSQQNKYNL